MRISETITNDFNYENETRSSPAQLPRLPAWEIDDN